jgi:hypothetical protein
MRRGAQIQVTAAPFFLPEEGSINPQYPELGPLTASIIHCELVSRAHDPSLKVQSSASNPSLSYPVLLINTGRADVSGQYLLIVAETAMKGKGVAKSWMIALLRATTFL